MLAPLLNLLRTGFARKREEDVIVDEALKPIHDDTADIMINSASNLFVRADVLLHDVNILI